MASIHTLHTSTLLVTKVLHCTHDAHTYRSMDTFTHKLKMFYIVTSKPYQLKIFSWIWVCVSHFPTIVSSDSLSVTSEKLFYKTTN